MQRGLFLGFALIVYAIFFATLLYLVAFVGNLAPAPLTVDRGPTAPLAVAVLVNLALIALFGVQHSVMARQGFKRAWTRIVPPPIERSVYVLAASLALIVLMMLWRPIGGTLWDASGTALELPLWGLFALGWLIVLVSTFLVNHFELFGLQQPWLHATGRAAAEPKLRQPLLYKLVRHPIYTGFFLALWATPVMSYGHLLLAFGLSVYTLIGIRHEERDLVGEFGEEYVAYRDRVGMLTPRLGRRGTPAA